MNGGLLPFLLMGTAVALALTYVPPRLALPGIAGFAMGGLLLMLAPFPQSASSAIFVGFWLSTIAAAALVLVPSAIKPQFAIGAAINGGLWAGAFTSVTGMRASLAIAMSLTFFFVPGRWFRCGKREIVLKVLSSWLIAVSALAMSVSLVATPGYEPDHME